MLESVDPRLEFAIRGRGRAGVVRRAGRSRGPGDLRQLRPVRSLPGAPAAVGRERRRGHRVDDPGRSVEQGHHGRQRQRRACGGNGRVHPGRVLFASERIDGRVARRREVVWGEPGTSWPGTRLRGRTAAIVGYGSIGRETARLLHGCGVRILAVKANPAERSTRAGASPGTGDPDGALPERWAGPDRLHEVLAEADYVRPDRARHGADAGLIDAAALAAMRPGCLDRQRRARLADRRAGAGRGAAAGRHRRRGAGRDGGGAAAARTIRCGSCRTAS